MRIWSELKSKCVTSLVRSLQTSISNTLSNCGRPLNTESNTIHIKKLIIDKLKAKFRWKTVYFNSAGQANVCACS